MPKTFKVLRGFLGCTGYYRCFVHNYGVTVKSLTDLLKKDNFSWSVAAQEAFDVLKLALIYIPMFALQDISQTFILENNASHSGVGVVLLQAKQPLTILSKALAPL